MNARRSLRDRTGATTISDIGAYLEATAADRLLKPPVDQPVLANWLNNMAVKRF
jgi:hypothetical protein